MKKMNEQNCKRKLTSNDEIDDNKTSSFGFEAGEVPMVDTIGDGNSNVNDELKLKMAALESENASLKANNKLLESKFEESRAKILLLTEENKALKLMKDIDQEIPNNEKLADLEEQPEEMANNMDQRMEYFVEKLKSLEEKHEKEIAELKLESLSREELIKLVKQQPQQLESSARQNNMVLTTKNGGGDDGNGELAMGMKLRDIDHSDDNNTTVELKEWCKEQLAQLGSLVQVLSQRIDQLQKENQELRKEMEENYIRKRMKIQLPLENWVDLFGFVPRRQLVKLVPQIFDPYFVEVLQYFLQKVGNITLDFFHIIPPERNDPNSRPMVETSYPSWPSRPKKFKLADAPIPDNIKNFRSIHLRYFDISVINFLRHFQQNYLLENITLWLSNLSNEKLRVFLAHMLPLIDSIQSIETSEIHQLIQICEDSVENNNGLSQILKTAMAQTRILDIRNDDNSLEPIELDWYCRWLYTARSDGRPRVLMFSTRYCPNGISSIIDRIKQDFLMANHQTSFFICIYNYLTFEWNITCENGRTNEKLTVKRAKHIILISRHPSETANKWIEENENEIKKWTSKEKYRRIALDHRNCEIAI